MYPLPALHKYILCWGFKEFVKNTHSVKEVFVKPVFLVLYIKFKIG